MTKVNIDLGESTSFEASVSAAVAAASKQSTTVGFETATEFSFHSALNLNVLNMSSEYSLKEWLITNRYYRETGSVTKVATRNIDVGCKSFFAGGDSFDIKSQQKVMFVSGTNIKVRVDKNKPTDTLADDTNSVLEMSNNGNCGLKKCADIKVLAGNGASKKKCVEVSKAAGCPTVSFFDDALKLKSDTGVNILDKVLVGSDKIEWVDSMAVDKTSATITKSIHASSGSVRINGSASVIV